MYKNFKILTICRCCFQFSAILSKFNNRSCMRFCVNCGAYFQLDNTLLVCEGA